MAIIDSKPLRTAITAVFITSQVYSLDSIKEPVKRGRTVPKISRSTSDIRPLRGKLPLMGLCADAAGRACLPGHRPIAASEDAQGTDTGISPDRSLYPEIQFPW